MKHKNTILVVPSKGAPLRRLELSNRQLIGLCTALVAVTAMAVLSVWALFGTGVSRAEIERLERENESLREANHRFEEGLALVRDRLGDYEERTRKLAIVAGLELDPADGEPGVGGESEPADSGRDLGALATRSTVLNARLDAVESELDRRMALLSATPSIAPAAGLMTSGFGYRTDPLTGTRSYHRGVDIGTGPDQPVVAAADGVVVRAGRDGDLGRAVRLSHDFGYSTRYGHLSRLAVRAGEQVRRGQILGYVGTSGRSTGYHLHYEVRRDGRALDPLPYLWDGPGSS